MKIAAFVVATVIAAGGVSSVSAQRPSQSAATAGQVLTFRMIHGQPFVTVVLDGGWMADFALAAKGAACAVRRDLAVQLWPDEAASAHRTTLTLGEVVLRNVPCGVGAANAIALSTLGWSVTFDYAARELVLRRTRPADEIGRPSPSK